MKGLELIKQAFALQEAERVPWVPFVGVHGGHLTGVDAETYLKAVLKKMNRQFCTDEPS